MGRSHSGGTRAPPPLPERQPSDQPGAAHHGHRAAANRDRGGRTTTGRMPPGRLRWRRWATSNGLSDVVYRTMPGDHTAGKGDGVREGNGATSLTPARPAPSPIPTLRTSHSPDSPAPGLRPHSHGPLDTEESLESMPPDGSSVSGTNVSRRYGLPVTTTPASGPRAVRNGRCAKRGTRLRRRCRR